MSEIKKNWKEENEIVTAADVLNGLSYNDTNSLQQMVFKFALRLEQAEIEIVNLKNK